MTGLRGDVDADLRVEEFPQSELSQSAMVATCLLMFQV